MQEKLENVQWIIFPGKESLFSFTYFMLFVHTLIIQDRPSIELLICDLLYLQIRNTSTYMMMFFCIIEGQ